MRHANWPFFLLALAFAAPSLPSRAQEPPEEGPEGPMQEEPMTPERMERVRERMEVIKYLQLMDALNLSQAESEKILPVLKGYDRERQALFQNRGELAHQLEDALRMGKGDVEALAEQLHQNEVRLFELREKEWKELKGLMTPEQRARYLVFEGQFQRRMHQMIEEARRGRPPMERMGRPGMGRGEGMGRFGPRRPRGEEGQQPPQPERRRQRP